MVRKEALIGEEMKVVIQHVKRLDENQPAYELESRVVGEIEVMRTRTNELGAFVEDMKEGIYDGLRG